MESSWGDNLAIIMWPAVARVPITTAPGSRAGPGVFTELYPLNIMMDTWFEYFQHNWFIKISSIHAPWFILSCFEFFIRLLHELGHATPSLPAYYKSITLTSVTRTFQLPSCPLSVSAAVHGSVSPLLFIFIIQRVAATGWTSGHALQPRHHPAPDL